MTVYRHDLPSDIPPRILSLPVDERGYPVPWFVKWIDGKPEFRVMDVEKLIRAIHERRCWICGEPLGSKVVFVIGPMSAINRISPEPPSHRECSRFAVKACPFLARPHMVRREDEFTKDLVMAGRGVKRNPGVTVLWYTRDYKPFRAGTGLLLTIGHPFFFECFKEGRTASKAEIRESIIAGLPDLIDAAQKDVPGSMEEAAHSAQQAGDLLGVGSFTEYFPRGTDLAPKIPSP